MSAAIDILNPEQPKHVAIVALRAMDNSLSNAPGLVFVKELSTWFIVNRKCEPIIRIEGTSELSWYLGCLECAANDLPIERNVVGAEFLFLNPPRPGRNCRSVSENASSTC